MKKFFLLLIMFSFISCSAQEKLWKNTEVAATVVWIQDDTAQITTRNYGVKYQVASKDSRWACRDLIIGKEYWFSLIKIEEGHDLKVRRATIVWIAVTPEQAAIDVKNLMASHKF